MKLKSNFLPLLLSFILLFNVSIFAKISVKIDNNPITFSSDPVNQNGTTLVPMRKIFESLGCTVSWEDSTKTITATKDSIEIKLTLGSTVAYKNGTPINLTVAPQSINGSTYVPPRFVAESLGCKVGWDNPSQTVLISTNNTTTTKSNTMQYNGKTYTIIEVDGGNLSGNRQANVAVDVGFGNRIYWAFTNEYGQLVNVIADKVVIQDDKTESVNKDGRYYPDEAKVPGTEQEDLDEGHVIADSLGGVSNAYNITPQDSTLNRHGNQAYMEKVIRDAGGCTNFVATITYPNTTTQIPSHYHYEYILNGNKIIDDFDNVNPDKVNATLVQPQKETIETQVKDTTKTYYWTPSGKSYHTTKDCPSLARSKTILSGTLSDATAAGKTDPCDKCN